MRLVISGLTVSSCWGNGHATQWRGHRERDVPYIASHRALHSLECGGLVLPLNVTPAATRQMGYCPLGRSFGTGACGVPLSCEQDQFFEPGTEITVAHLAEQAVEVPDLMDAELTQVACAARERTLTCHTALGRFPVPLRRDRSFPSQALRQRRLLAKRN